jgi:hypothetical protein
VPRCQWRQAFEACRATVLYILFIKYIEKVPEVSELESLRQISSQNKTKSIQRARQMLNRWTTNMVY